VFILDQVASWVMVALCLWLVHQTAGPKFDSRTAAIGFFLMRFGLGALGISVAAVSIFHVMGSDILSGGIWKTAVNVLLLGIAVFHKGRFNKS